MEDDPSSSPPPFQNSKKKHINPSIMNTNISNDALSTSSFSAYNTNDTAAAAAATAGSMSAIMNTTDNDLAVNSSSVAPLAAGSSVASTGGGGGGVMEPSSSDLTIASQQQQALPTPQHHSIMMNRPSSLSSKSRYSGTTTTATAAVNNHGINRLHAYFASSEEESEAELTEVDSHSSADHHHPHSHHRSNNSREEDDDRHHSSQPIRPKSGILASSKLRLSEIASKVSSAGISGKQRLHGTLQQQQQQQGMMERKPPAPVVSFIPQQLHQQQQRQDGDVGKPKFQHPPSLSNVGGNATAAVASHDERMASSSSSRLSFPPPHTVTVGGSNATTTTGVGVGGVVVDVASSAATAAGGISSAAASATSTNMAIADNHNNNNNSVGIGGVGIGSSSSGGGASSPTFRPQRRPRGRSNATTSSISADGNDASISSSHNAQFGNNASSLQPPPPSSSSNAPQHHINSNNPHHHHHNRHHHRHHHHRHHGRKHLPKGLPVFKDPRSCMWTSTHDANAPSEDRYSSLVNVLLRPPKTLSGGGGGKIGSNSGGGGGGGTSVEGENDAGNNSVGSKKVDGVNGNGGVGGVETNGGDIGSNCESSGNINLKNDSQHSQQSNSTKPPPPPPSSKLGPEQQVHIPPSEEDEDNTSLIRLSLWSVIDGHGGGCVATYAAEVLLPHIAASVARSLKSEIVDRGVCNVNGQLRDANALDLDGLIRSSDRSRYDNGNNGGNNGGGGRSVGSTTASGSTGGGKSSSGRKKSAIDRQREAGIDVVNPNSIHYRSPYEDSGSEGECQGVDDEDIDDDDDDHASRGTKSTTGQPSRMSRGESESESEAESEAPVSVASSLLPGNPICANSHEESVSSVKTSVKTAVSPVMQHAPVGTHSPAEVAAITRAITDSFLAVDEGWINSIDPVTTHQTSCVSNGRWNAGACALVVFIIQRLDWCRSSRVDHETHHRERGERGFDDTSHNKDAARRRKLDYATKSKSVSSLSTLSSTSSITTEANTTEMLAEESEITETEDDYDYVSDIFGPRRRRRKKTGLTDDPHNEGGVLIPTPAGCKCHYYRPHDAMLYTAHVGDCRAVMLGSAPPRTIKVPPEGHSSHSHSLDCPSEDTSSSESIADEISSSDHDSDSSEDLDFISPDGMLGYVRRSKRQRHNENSAIEHQQPFVPLPPLNRRDSSSEESAIESDDSTSTTHESFNRDSSAIRAGRGRVARVDVVDVNRPFNNLEEDKLLETEDEEEIKEIRSVRSGSPTQMDRATSPTATEPTQLVADPVHPPPSPLSMLMRPIDLTTDHSAYNPAEVTAVLRRCNNAPKAISSASGGGIKRVAGSLAVTRALGDAYLKTPRLSFFPYKRHAPYITARPEVNCRVLTKGADRILILASDGVWERAAGDDVLRWVRNYYNARIAGVKDQHLHPPLYAGGVEEHPFGEITKRISRRKYGSRHSDGDEELDGDENALGDGGSISNLCSTESKAATLTPPTDNTKSAGSSGNAESEEKLDESDAATSSEATTGTTTIADETTATAKSGTKRKYPGSTGSVSTRSSTASSRLGRGTRRHRSSRPYSLAIPTVSEVIVRKVLNKVRKTRNISSLRMLMSLPKGRARRSKHDDITATVVDLSGFVS